MKADNRLVLTADWDDQTIDVNLTGLGGDFAKPDQRLFLTFSKDSDVDLTQEMSEQVKDLLVQILERL